MNAERARALPNAENEAFPPLEQALPDGDPFVDEDIEAYRRCQAATAHALAHHTVARRLLAELERTIDELLEVQARCETIHALVLAHCDAAEAMAIASLRFRDQWEKAA